MRADPLTSTSAVRSSIAEDFIGAMVFDGDPPNGSHPRNRSRCMSIAPNPSTDDLTSPDELTLDADARRLGHDCPHERKRPRADEGVGAFDSWHRREFV
jgi:hypothetical protein